MEIVQAININGLHEYNTETNILNLVHIDMENNNLWNFDSQYKIKDFSYRFNVNWLLFSASTTNIIKTNFMCNSLIDVKTTIIHSTSYKTLGVARLDKITN